jgi:hypothetical protein
MTDIKAVTILENGAVLTKAGGIVNLELEGDRGLVFMSQIGQLIDTDRAEFDSRTDRDNALLNTVQLYIDEGWQLAGEKS